MQPASHESPYNHCSICTRLKDHEYAMQKGGREQDDTHLPAAAAQLVTIKDLKPGGGSRLLLLEQCPECGTCYLYRSDYEYLAGGSEDEQTLERLTAEQALTWLD